MKANFLLLFFCFGFFQTTYGQSIERIEPPHWYAGMANSDLQLMVYGENIQSLTPSINQDVVSITKVHKVDNKNYLFIDLDLSKVTKKTDLKIEFLDDDKVVLTKEYELLDRKKDSAQRKGFSPSDVVYLITPDRFANGNYSNDIIPSMKEKSIDRNEGFARHGGDIQGVIDHLDYINDMGFTSIWLNPVLENDQEKWSYHGYSTTDYYKVDPRMGSNEEYVALSQEAEKYGIGIIMDMIANHCGSGHWWMEDLPTSDWINYHGEDFQRTNHRKSTLLDPYAAPEDRTIMTDGWFVPTMPDLNQRNPFLAKYIIQNSIWWVEYADLQGIRQDTYSYPDKDFMADWTKAIMTEYPSFSIVGEEWVHDAATIAYWQKGKKNKDGYTSELTSLMDFKMNSKLASAFKDEESWNKGFVTLYENLAEDHHYADPSMLMIFADNHDMSRIFTQLDENVNQLKMAMAYILTMRGIPQVYYGTEILLSHPGTDSHGAIREDFPGGWKEDDGNAFEDSGLTEEALEFKSWMKNLLNWRKAKSVIHNGKLMHYSPQDGVYVYFRYDDEDTVMVVFNKNNNAVTIASERFSRFIPRGSKWKSIEDNEIRIIDQSFKVEGEQVHIFELDKKQK